METGSEFRSLDCCVVASCGWAGEEDTRRRPLTVPTDERTGTGVVEAAAAGAVVVAVAVLVVEEEVSVGLDFKDPTRRKDFSDGIVVGYFRGYRRGIC
jgi:hypothetical protein